MNVEQSIREIGRDLHRRAAGRRPAIFEPTDWLRRMIDKSLDDEDLRTALFRFVDVLPSLGSAREVGDHLQEYFSNVDHALGGLSILAGTLRAGWVVAPLVQRNVTTLARRFLVEDDEQELVAAVEALRAEPAGFTLDVVGEAVVSEGEAEGMCRRYERLLDVMSARAARWPEVPPIDRGTQGELPRVNVSVKLSALAARFDPLDAESEAIAADRLRRLLREAARVGAAITVDMEQRTLRESTIAIFRALLEEPEFRTSPSVSIALQAYLRDAEQSLEELIAWSQQSGRRIGVRLVKGAYWDSEIAWARQKGWPIPVFTDKGETDATFERMSQRLLESWPHVDAAFGSHNLRSLAFAIATADRLGLPRGAYEMQLLYGMAEPLRHALIDRGERVRVYVPVGDLLPGMAYLIRRLLENTSNVSFLRQSYADGADLDRLLSPPTAVSPSPAGSAGDLSPTGRGEIHRLSPLGRDRAEGASEGETSSDFPNEPLTDFSLESRRLEMAASLDEVHARIDADEHVTSRSLERLSGGEIASLNPADPATLVGRVDAASPGDVDVGVVLAAEGYRRWRERPIAERAAILREVARRMRERRRELAAWIVLEVGKGWRDADAEVAEAIDYAEFYAREMLAIGAGYSTAILPGERNELVYEPLGVAAVISPWNFPLAITAGMTLAALVTGNAVVLKPAEQSPVIGARLHEILLEAGVPLEACVFLPGDGEVGAALVRHPGVRLVAFTGSRAVGLDILRATAATPAADGGLKRVVCEMGGKNPLIVDADADRDEAILATLESAFGYQGQKCSAASRLIVVGDADPFLRRLADATLALRIGPPEDPRNAIGPLIEESAVARLREACAEARRDGRTILESEAPGEGYFFAPAIFTDLPPDHRVAREELFGPLLCAFSVDTFEHAIELANRTEYGLTAGVFSRSPAHLALARRELRAGNVYLNRGTTGAVVGRQPFGGIKLSGSGWKAGGRDYLKQFLESRTLTENTLRHGFVPDLPQGGSRA